MIALIDTNVILDVLLASVTGREIYQAVDLHWDDFEDCVQYSAGESIQADYIVSRDTEGYKDSAIPVVQPTEFLSAIERITQE